MQLFTVTSLVLALAASTSAASPFGSGGPVVDFARPTTTTASDAPAAADCSDCLRRQSRGENIACTSLCTVATTTTADTVVNDGATACQDCLQRQARGENVACTSICNGAPVATAATTTKSMTTTTTPASKGNNGRDATTTTARKQQGVADSTAACTYCLQRQAMGENVACTSLCTSVSKTTTTTAGPNTGLAGAGDVCYQFCEDGSMDFVQRECAEGLSCAAPNGMISFDSCGSRARTCVQDSQETKTTTTTRPASSNNNDVACKDCKQRQAKGENVACTSLCVSSKTTTATTTTAAKDCQCSWWHCHC